MPTTRREMRNSVGSALKDRLHLIATGGSTSTFEDVIELTDFDDTLAGSQMIFSSGSNAGRVVRVASNSQATSTLTFMPPLQTSVAVDDEADVFNLGNKGFRVQEYNDAITTIVGGRDYKNLREVVVQIYPAFDAYNPEIILPLNLVAVYAVQFQIGTELIHDLRAAGNSSNGWRIESGTRSLSIMGRSANMAHGSELTVLGYERNPTPVTDDDEIHLDEEWVRFGVIAHLCTNKSPQHDRWAVEALQKAAAREGFVTPSMQPNTVFMRETTS